MAASKNQLFIKNSFDRSFHIVLVPFYVPRQRPPELQVCPAARPDDDAPAPLQSAPRFLKSQSFLREREQLPPRLLLRVHWGKCLLALPLHEPGESRESVFYPVFRN